MTDRPLPTYTHIPGVTPHPIRDPAGHSYSGTASDIVVRPAGSAALNWNDLLVHPEFLSASTLFNAGYYWEAHEAWESLWHIAGRSGVMADFLKGLIKLAAAGVKLREHNSTGVARHAQRAHELFTEVQNILSAAVASSDHIPLRELIEIVEQLVQQPPPFPEDRTGRPVVVILKLPLP